MAFLLLCFSSLCQDLLSLRRGWFDVRLGFPSSQLSYDPLPLLALDLGKSRDLLRLSIFIAALSVDGREQLTIPSYVNEKFVQRRNLLLSSQVRLFNDRFSSIHRARAVTTASFDFVEISGSWEKSLRFFGLSLQVKYLTTVPVDFQATTPRWMCGRRRGTATTWILDFDDCGPYDCGICATPVSVED